MDETDIAALRQMAVGLTTYEANLIEDIIADDDRMKHDSKIRLEALRLGRARKALNTVVSLFVGMKGVDLSYDDSDKTREIIATYLSATDRLEEADILREMNWP